MSTKFLAALVALFGLGIAIADVYTWVDDDGQIHYSDKPDQLPAEVVSIESGATDPARIAAQTQAQQDLDEVIELRESQQAEDAAAEDQLRQETLAERASACEKAKQRYESYIQAHRLYNPTADGEREYLSDAEIDQARLEAKQAVDKWCS